jgi:hypothetical protein
MQRTNHPCKDHQVLDFHDLTGSSTIQFADPIQRSARQYAVLCTYKFGAGRAIEATMGLFSTALHFYDVEREKLIPAFDCCLAGAGFRRAETLSVPASGPGSLPGKHAWAGPCYLASPLQGRWLTVIEAHFAIDGAPQPAHIAKEISGALSCYALALIVHDDDLFFYSLEHNGESLDGYNSCPQYFEQKRLPDSEVEGQRHTPDAFGPILPRSCTLEDLASLLNRGWWNAYDRGELDQDGVAQGEGDGFVFESERMTAFGTMLQLHGTSGHYPYAAWRESQDIPWTSFVVIRYQPS